MKKYIFHYNGDCANVDESEFLEPGEMTYHEHLLAEDGKTCETDVSNPDVTSTGMPCVEAYFEDGNELTVYLSELEEVQ